MRNAKKPISNKQPRPSSCHAPARQQTAVSLDEMRRMEEQAAKLERLSQTLLNTTQQAFYVYDHVRKEFLLGHEQISGLYGYKPGEIESRKDGWFGIVHPDDREQMRQASKQMMKSDGNEVHSHRIRILRKNGGIEWIQVHKRVFERDEKGAAISEIGMVRVITPQVQDETALRDSKEVLHSLFEHNTAGVLLLDSTMRVQDANPILCRMLQYDRKTMLRLDMLDLVAPGNRADVEKRLKGLQNGSKLPTSFETRLETRGGTLLDVLAASTCHHDDTRGCHQCMMIFTDVTARKAAETALRREFEMNRILIENTPIAIGLLDLEGRVKRINRTTEDLFGFKEKEVLNQCIWDLPFMPKHEVSASQKRFQSLLQGKEKVSTMLSLRTKGGETRYIAAETTAVRSNGKIDHIVVIGADVTERKRLEAEVIRVAEQEHVRIGADLHDGVGQTLAGIASLTEALLQTLGGQAKKDTGRILELIKTAQEEVRRLSHGLAPSAVKNRDLAGGLKLIAETIRLNFRRECECVLDESIRLHDKEAETHLFRIAQEAVNNALRHGGAHKIRIGLRRHDKGSCVLEIIDDGSGFATRASKDPAPNAGGIGLRVMEYRANLLGGRLQIRSQPGRGVRLTCYFPDRLLRDRQLTTR